jgi:hypothetical protein
LDAGEGAGLGSAAWLLSADCGQTPPNGTQPDACTGAGSGREPIAEKVDSAAGSNDAEGIGAIAGGVAAVVADGRGAESGSTGAGAEISLLRRPHRLAKGAAGAARGGSEAGGAGGGGAGSEGAGGGAGGGAAGEDDGTCGAGTDAAAWVSIS